MAEQQAWAKAHYQLLTETGERVGVTVSGRDKWALSELIQAGERGCTPIDNPAPRWSAYVHGLRGLGAPIETIIETHGGPFSGNHARYVLRAIVAASQEVLK